MSTKGYALTNETGGLAGTANNYAEMFIYENGTATTIGTVNIYHLIQNFSTGLVNNWTFDAGQEVAIQAFSDGGGGTVTVVASGHTLQNGEIITISGTTNYNGVFIVSNVSGTTFKITDTWVADDAAGVLYQGSSLKAGTGAAGLYGILWNISGTSAGTNKVYQTAIFHNATEVTKSAIEQKLFTSGDVQGMAGPMRLVQIADGDYITLGVECTTDASNTTIIHAAVSLHRIGA